MKQEIKQRIVGAIIFVIFISTMVPPILDGRNSENKSNEVFIFIIRKVLRFGLMGMENLKRT